MGAISTKRWITLMQRYSLVYLARFDEDTCRACRRIWRDIASKAPRQRHKIGSDYNDQHKIYLD